MSGPVLSLIVTAVFAAFSALSFIGGSPFLGWLFVGAATFVFGLLIVEFVLFCMMMNTAQDYLALWAELEEERVKEGEVDGSRTNQPNS